MRILYLNPIGEIGGAEKSLLDILGVVRTHQPGWQLGLITGGPGTLVARAEALGVTVRTVTLPEAIAGVGDSGGYRQLRFGKCLQAGISLIRYIVQLREVIRGFRPDIVHTNGFKMHILGVWGKPSGTPAIWHIRDYVSSRPIMRRLLRFHKSFCAGAIVNSQSVGHDVRSICGPSLHVQCIYNAVDLEDYRPEGSTEDLDALSQLEPAEPDAVRIGLLATMARWKGQVVFLKALAELPSDLKYRASVIGGPIYRTEHSQYTIQELRALAAKLDIADKVGFTGFLPDSARAIRALDIVVHASTEPEPFGRVIAEAMACGRAVISSGTGGARELITEGKDAVTHEPGDHVELARRISELARNAALRGSMGRCARETAERRFSPCRLAADLIPLYRAVLTDRLHSASSDTHAASAPY